MDFKISLSIIVPVYNEEENIPVLFKQIQNALNPISSTWEALFVDDGSIDGSLAALRKLAACHSNVRYVSFEQNCGQSAALAAGFVEARGEVLVTIDADLQNVPADIPLLLAELERGYDMVIGWRAGRQDTWAKRKASKFANGFRNLLTHESVRDTGCSLKAMRADMAKNLPMFKGMHRFLPTLMKMQGAIVSEVKVSHRPRLHGNSKYGIWDRAFSGLYDLLAVRWMQHRSYSYTIKERM